MSKNTITDQFWFENRADALFELPENNDLVYITFEINEDCLIIKGWDVLDLVYKNKIWISETDSDCVILDEIELTKKECKEAIVYNDLESAIYTNG